MPAIFSKVRKTSGVGFLLNVGFDDINDLLLLSSREPRHSIKNLAESAAGRPYAFRLLLAEQLFHGYAEGFGHRNQYL